MLLIERFDHESDSQFDLWLENLYAQLPERLRVSLDKDFADIRASIPRVRAWARPFRRGRRAGWSGRMFCEIECFYLTLYMYLVQAVEDGIARDALIVEWRGRLHDNAHDGCLMAAVIHNGIEQALNLDELTQLSDSQDRPRRPFPNCWDDGRHRWIP
jgi:hypothetical protein